MKILPVPWKQFLKDLSREAQRDNISTGAAALAYYLTLAIFPAAIALLSLLPFLPIPHLDQAIMDLLKQILPTEAANSFTTTIDKIVSSRKGGLLSFGLLFTLWAASNGMYAVMEVLNMSYNIEEARPFWKARGTALILTILFGFLIISAFGLIIFGGILQNWLESHLHLGKVLLVSFSLLRWAIIWAAITFGFALIYSFGPDVKRSFRFLTPGSGLGVTLLIVASLGFRIYVDNFGAYDATYGSLGAIITLMLWLYLAGLAILLGSEINALMDSYPRQSHLKRARH